LVDHIIQANRAATPQRIADQRIRPRLSIGEINQLSQDGIRAGLDPAGEGDDRSAAVRFLDMLDLPRNTIANVAFGEPTAGGIIGTIGGTAGAGALIGAFGGLAGAGAGALIGAGIGAAGLLGAQFAGSFVPEETRRSILSQSSGRGAVGQRSIFFSDALREVGVENRVARAVLGFTGDVLMDPTSYVSGGGNTVLRVAANGAKIRLARPVVRRFDDIAGAVVRGAPLPQGSGYDEIVSLYADGIKVGDELIPVIGPGSQEAILRAAKATGSARTQRRRVADFLLQDVLDRSQRPITGVSGRLDATSREWLRRHAANSDYAITIPMAGLLGNWLRTPLDIQLGKLGKAGAFKKALGATEGEFAERAGKAAARQTLSIERDLAVEAGVSGVLRRRVPTEILKAEAASRPLQVGDRIKAGKRTGRIVAIENGIADVEVLNRQTREFTTSKVDLAGRKAAVAKPRRERAIPDDIFKLATRNNDQLELDASKLTPLQREFARKAGFKPTSAINVKFVDDLRRSRELLDYDNRLAKIASTAADIEQLKALKGEASADIAEEAEKLATGQEGFGVTGFKDAVKNYEQLTDALMGESAHLIDLNNPGMVRFLDGMDEGLNSIAEGDAYTRMRGPMAYVAKWAGRTKLQELRNQVANATRNADADIRAMKRQRSLLIKRERKVNVGPGEGSLIRQQIENLNKQIDTARRTLATSIENINRDIAAIEGSTFFNVWRAAAAIKQGALRNLLGIGRKDTEIQKAVRDFQRQADVRADIARKDIVRDWSARRTETIARHLGLSENDVNVTVLAELSHRAAARGQTGFTLDDIIFEEAGQVLQRMPDITSDPSIARMVDEFDQRLAKLRTDEIEAGILPDVDTRTLYVPGMFAADAAKAAIEEGRLLGNARVASGLDYNPHTLRKATNRYFYEIDGQQRHIYSGLLQVPVGELTDEGKRLRSQFEAWRADKIAREGLPSNWLPDAYATSPFQLNKDRINFQDQVPPTFTGDIFEQDPMFMLAQRTAAHHRAIAARKFRNFAISQAKAFSEDHLPFLPRATGGGVEIDGVRYRKLNENAIKDSALQMPIDSESARYFYPEPWAAAIEDMAKKFRSETDINAMLKGFDSVHNFIKKFMLLHPAWFTTNALGGAINSWVAGGSRPEKWIQHAANYLPVIRKLHGDGIDALSVVKKVNTPMGEMSERELGEFMIANGITNPHQTALGIINAVRTGSWKQGTIAMRIKSTPGQLANKWFSFNSQTDDLFRAITIFDRMEQGEALGPALQRMHDSHFDYGSMTSTEQAIGTRAMSFYRFMRNNIALQFKLLLDKPAFAASFPKIRNAIEEALLTEEPVPADMRPRWMQDQIATQIGEGPQKRFLLLSMFTPVQELIEIGQAAMGGDGFADMAKYFVSSLNPLPKALFEFGFGEEAFTGRPIGKGEFGEISYSQHLLSMFRPYREVIGATRMLNREDVDPIDFVMRGLVGGRLQQTSQERLEAGTAFEKGETSRRLRSAIKRTQDNGDEAEARRLAVRLVDLYRRLYNLGMVDLVPRGLRGRFLHESRGTAAPIRGDLAIEAGAL
jgi:hypothetical protein